MNRKRNQSFLWTDAALLLVSVVFFAGMLTFLSSCGPKEDGSWMTCHWACQTLRGVSCAMVVLSVLRLFFDHRVRIGLDIGTIVLSMLAICVPGRLIGLCMMGNMRCHSIMTPGAVVLSVVMIATAGVDLILRARRGQST